MIEQLFSSQVVQAIGWTLVHTLWQAALFALLTGVLLLLLRRFSSQARYIVTVGMLGIFFLTAVYTFYQQYKKMDVSVLSMQLRENEEELAIKREMTDLSTPANSALNSREPKSYISATSNLRARMVSYYDQHLPLIVTLWLMGVLVLQLRFLGQLAFIQRLKNYGAQRFPAEWATRIQHMEEQLSIRRSVQYLTSFRVNTPLTTGWLQPVVFFPRALLQELEDSQVMAILAHELAHIKRNDFLVNLIQTLLCILFFYHPAVWWMSARIKDEREHCCDDLAIQVTQKPLGYAKTLIHLKEKEMQITNTTAVAFAGRKPQGFKQRITRLVSGYFRTATYGEGIITAFILITMMGTAVFAAQYEPSIQEALTTADKQQEAPLTTSANVAVVVDDDVDYDVDMEVETEGTDVSDLEMIAMDADGSAMLLPLTDFELLMEAVDDGNTRLVKYFLDQEIDLNQTNRKGFTPLMLAASENHPEIARLLIEAGAEVDYVNRNGWTALIEAADEGSYATAQVLLDAGADVNLRGSEHGRSAVAMAASEGHSRVLGLLMENGAEWNKRNGAHSPVHLAAEEGQLDVLEMLLSKGANINVTDEHGRTALMYAAEEGQYTELEYLIEKGADVNITDIHGRTALSYAAEENESMVIANLLDAGAEVNVKDESGRSALDYAAREGADDALEQLMNDGSTETKQWALHPSTIIEAAGEGELYIIKELIAAGGDVNIVDEDGVTPLSEAAREGELQVVRYLLDNGAQIDPDRSRQAASPLFLAAGEDVPLVVELLLERGANVEYRHTIQSININSRKRPMTFSIYKAATPLFVAIEEESTRTVEVLLRKGANPNATIKKRVFILPAGSTWNQISDLTEDSAEENHELRYDVSNWTPLMEAAELGDKILVDKLLEAGAEAQAKNSDGLRAGDIARRLGHSSIAERLR